MYLKILNRPFALIALGGCGDSGFLDGHDYTYEGSKYGKIIDILIQSECLGHSCQISSNRTY